MRNQFTNKKFLYSTLYFSIFIYPLIASADVYAEATQLGDVQVVGSKKKKANRKDNEITGLGKITKNSDTINKEQVLNIRDLVRYDPGVAVVEQGRGASAGYSIRGVDKNRVALMVDGIPQAQSYVMQGENSRARHGGGSINEIENENITSIEISKGASSAEYGSGSLGGAIGFRTKEPNDIIPEGKNWGLATKSAYSSKNKQYTNSLGFAGRAGGFEGLVQYTHKVGKSTQIHKDAINTTNYQITRLGPYLNEYDLRGEPNEKSSDWFVIEGECGTQQCEPRPKVRTTDPFPIPSVNREFTEEEKQAIAKMPHIKETVPAESYTGNDRVVPDPMKYRTGSWLAKIGYHFNEKHYIGGVFEETKQRYDIRDMTTKSFYTPSEKDTFAGSRGIYTQARGLLDGLSYNGIGFRWSRTQFFDENHKKTRSGLAYRYTGNKESFFDALSLTWDNQKITLDTQIHNPLCTEYPNVDKNCRPTPNKLGSYYASERNTYSENHNLIKLSLDKRFTLYKMKHNVNLTMGADYFKSQLDRSDYYQQLSIADITTTKGNGTFNNPYVYHIANPRVETEQLCTEHLSAFRDCRTRIIKGNNKFIALKELINVNKYLDIGLGGRLDKHTFSTNDPWTSVRDYSTKSWNVGVVIKPTKNIALSYRMSNGFRIPSFQEMFGYRVPGLERGKDDNFYKTSLLEPEKSLNKEIGLGFKGDFGTLELSYFRNEYDKLITIAKKDNKTPSAYHNAQFIEVEGINLIGKLDWNGIYDKLPEGLYSNLAYNRIKPKRIKNDPSFASITSYAFDTLQPSRYIASLGYDDPDNKWGVNATMTYSKAKNPDELQVTNVGFSKTYTTQAAKRTAKSWYIYDLIGYMNVHKNVTLRMGIYNIMNYRYTTWESIRQSAQGSINQQHDVGNYARYAAPGRNFTFSFEMKF
ncbi:lactoferrin/transferrin family TonB-dependent receptor [Ursidibacter arcticus]